MAGYPFKEIETRWQAFWEADKTFRTPADIDTSKPKYYVLDMFPYPSGAGLHVGHPEGYTATDIVARYRRMKGFNVLHPIGWDAFGLPAEQYALKTGTHPSVTTQKNVGRFRDQLQSLGFSYDWDREISTTDPGFYRWTQWIFRKLFERGLAYEAAMPVWWCPELGTTLANEEVVDGLSDIGGHPCEKRKVRQWVLKITEYAERLLTGLDDVDWPESTKRMQRNWIGRSEGADIDFPVVDLPGEAIRVFTTRPDTIFGATYMVLAPEHPLVERVVTPTQREVVQRYCLLAACKSDLERTSLQKEKTGVFTGGYAVNTATKERIPIWIADYVLVSYGTGAIMAVPGQDERDWEFAEAFDLPILRTVQPPEDFDGKAYTGDGPATNSGFLDGLHVDNAKKRIIDYLEREGLGERKVNYKLRDWLFSRQRYWGEPLPVIFCDGEAKVLPEDHLPVTLPELEEFKPSGSPEGPLALAENWLHTTDPETGRLARRETNTMPQWAGSCWYFLRYIDPDNSSQLVDPELEEYWMPVDLYIGGAEHAVLHLLYARFWHMVLHDAGVVASPEPFRRLVHQGMILGETEYTAYLDSETATQVSAERIHGGIDKTTGREVSGQRIDESTVIKDGDHFVLKDATDIRVEVRAHKMSKSRGNVINPDDIIEAYGADAFRLYEMFMGPLEHVKQWSTRGVEGTYRFLNRVWRLVVENERVREAEPSRSQLRLLHRTIERVTADIDSLRLNTAIAALMEFVNAAKGWDTLPKSVAERFVVLLSPFAPHIAESLWEHLGNTPSLAYAEWPVLDRQNLKEEDLRIAVQVNGRVRATITIPAEADRNAVLLKAKGEHNVARFLRGKALRREIYVPGRIVNFVAV